MNAETVKKASLKQPQRKFMISYIDTAGHQHAVFQITEFYIRHAKKCNGILR
jgi:hypothetical protein